jgi:hypothetical protein
VAAFSGVEDVSGKLLLAGSLYEYSRLDAAVPGSPMSEHSKSPRSLLLQPWPLGHLIAPICRQLNG